MVARRHLELFRVDAKRTQRNLEDARGRRSGAPGSVVAVGEGSFEVATSDGSIVVRRVRPKGGKKSDAGEFAREVGLSEGARLGA